MIAPTQTLEYIKIPAAPEIPGLKFRHYRGETDLPAMVKLNNLANLADRTGEIETLDQLSHHFAHLKNCDPQNDVVLGELNGEFIIYCRVHWVELDDGTFIYRLFGNIHPEFRRKGLGPMKNIALGLVGAFLGGFVVHLTRWDLGWGPVLIRYEELAAALAGSILLMLVLRFLTRKRDKENP